MKKFFLFLFVLAIMLLMPTMAESGTPQVPPKITRPTSANKVVGKNVNRKKNVAKTTSGKENGHDYIDLGLSVNWATMNIGAKDIYDRGDEYAWGEITTNSVNWETYFDTQSVEKDINGFICPIFKKYHHGSGGKGYISPDDGHDVCRNNWGGRWRLPTREEFQELIDKCKWQRKMIKGRDVYVITGPNGNKLFLVSSMDPSEGYYWGWYQYWTSSLDMTRDSKTEYDHHDEHAYCFMRSAASSYDGIYDELRIMQMNLRAVFDK